MSEFVWDCGQAHMRGLTVHIVLALTAKNRPICIYFVQVINPNKILIISHLCSPFILTNWRLICTQNHVICQWLDSYVRGVTETRGPLFLWPAWDHIVDQQFHLEWSLTHKGAKGMQAQARFFLYRLQAFSFQFDYLAILIHINFMLTRLLSSTETHVR